MQPAKPSTDMMPPTTTNSVTGSRPSQICQCRDVGENACAGGTEAGGGTGHPTISAHSSPAPHPCLTFSLQAQRPMARNRAPSTCKNSSKELKAPVAFPSQQRPLPAGAHALQEATGRQKERKHCKWDPGSFPSVEDRISVFFPQGTAWNTEPSPAL